MKKHRFGIHLWLICAAMLCFGCQTDSDASSDTSSSSETSSPETTSSENLFSGTTYKGTHHVEYTTTSQTTTYDADAVFVFSDSTVAWTETVTSSTNPPSDSWAVGRVTTYTFSYSYSDGNLLLTASDNSSVSFKYSKDYSTLSYSGSEGGASYTYNLTKQ